MATKIVILKESTNDGTLYFTGYLGKDRLVWSKDKDRAFDYNNVDEAYDVAADTFERDFDSGVVNVEIIELDE